MNKFLLFCLLFLAPVSIASADLKVAVVDLSKAFDQYWKTKEAQQRINDKKAGYQKDIEEMKTDYDHMVEEANSLSAAAKDQTLSAEARAEKQKALDAKVGDLRTMQGKITENDNQDKSQLEDEIFRLHKEILEEIMKVVSDYSGPQGFDLVLDKSSSTSTVVPIVLYNSSKLIDITPDIISKLNATAPAPTGTAPAGSAPSGAGTAPASR